MTKPDVLVVCGVFADELESLLPDAGRPDILWLDPALHVNFDRLEGELVAALKKVNSADRNVRVLFGSGCHPDICRMVLNHGASIWSVGNCIEAFCGKEEKEALEADRTMIMTPGWVRAWPRIMEALGWDVVDVRINLGIYDRILLLEPGVNPLTEDEILEFFDLVQVPVEIRPCNLDRFRAVLDDLVE